MGKRKRKEAMTIHPHNKYSQNPPDFALLASLYPSFEPFVVYSRDGRPGIDWLDYNSTRELTRVLLHHDHGIVWWIPDGQLCPPVPNRSNYIHWINDLLSLDIFLPNKRSTDGQIVKGFDIGTGANCIYPLLGASLLGWSFVGSDVADVALEWALKNVENNPRISKLIEIRRVMSSENRINALPNMDDEDHSLTSSSTSVLDGSSKYDGPPVLVGVVQEGETFDFCMCNPPFFATMEEAGLNPKTCFGGTPEEMMCTGGELAFITRIIEDSVVLKMNFRWYTSMVGKKNNLKALPSKLWEVGATVVKTTEFVQGRTSRWGIAWSFHPTVRKLISPQLPQKTKTSYMLEGFIHHCSPLDVLLSVETFFSSTGASCKLNTTTFSIKISASTDQCDALLKTQAMNQDERNAYLTTELIHDSNQPSLSTNNLNLNISVFQQTPGILLVQGSLIQREISSSGLFSSVMQRLHETLRSKFCRRIPLS